MEKLKIEVFDVITPYKYYDWGTGDYVGVSFKDIKDKIKEFSGSEIELYINSEGGSVFEANAIFEVISGHKAKVTSHIVSIAASAASYLALAADEVIMANNSYYMIHNPASWGGGDYRDMKSVTDLLIKVTDQIAKIYADKSGQTIEKVKQWMDDETWFTAEEALEYGFVDKISKGINIAACLDKNMISEFKNAPEDIKERINNNNNNFNMENNEKNPLAKIMEQIDNKFAELKNAFTEKTDKGVVEVFDKLTDEVSNTLEAMQEVYNDKFAEIQAKLDTVKPEQIDVENFATKEDLDKIDNKAELEAIQNSLKSVSAEVGKILNQKNIFNKVQNEDIEIDAASKTTTNDGGYIGKSKY